MMDIRARAGPASGGKELLMERSDRWGPSLPSVVIAAVFAFATLAPAQTWNGRIVKEGAVTVVLNPREPIVKAPLIELKRDWTAGGETAAGRSGLAKPWDIALDDEGRLYVLDIQDASVKVFDPQGAYVRTIGRRGQGPGEIGAAFSIIVPWRAKTLIVNDVGGRRLAFFSLEGVFEKNLSLRGLTESPAVDSRFDIYLKTTDIRNSRESLNKMNADLTAVLARIFDEPVDESHNPFKPRTRWILDAQDRLILGRARAYEFEIYDSDGRLSRKIRREYSPSM
jgi:6-bladed beta-propeller